MVTTASTRRDAMQALASYAIAEGVPEWIMWMPGGTHKITGIKAGKRHTTTVTVDPTVASAMQACLLEWKANSRQRPFIDFDHDNKAASGWPEEFAWRESPEPGVWMRLSWSDAGRKAIAGHEYRTFSPQFFTLDDDVARVDGAPLNMGGLVNDPAFREIAPIWARSADPEDTATTNKSDRMDELTAKTELAALQARVVELEHTNEELKAAAATAETEEAIKAKDAEIVDLKAKLDEAGRAAEDRRKRDAMAAVQSAVSRGAIAAKDTASQDKWQALIMSDPRNAELLAALPGRPALTAGRITRSSVEIIKPDTNDVIRAYVSAGTPREKGMIYMREISPLLQRGENPLARYPVQAVNTLGTLVNALVSQRVLELVVSRRPMLRGVVTDFSDEVRSKDDTVKTRTIGLPTVQDFGGTVSATADTDVTVTLDLFKEVRYTFTAAEVVGTARNLVAERSEAMALALGNSMVDALAALITETNFGTSNQTIKASASIDFSTLTAVNKAMNNTGVPDTYRFGWVNEDVAEALRNDEIIMSSYDRSPMASAYAHWSNVVGFTDIWEFPALPGNSVNLTGFFASRSALIIAARVPRNPAELVGSAYPGTLAVVTDPVTGLSVVRNEWIDADDWEVNCRLIALYGVDLGQAACGHTLVSAA